MPNRIEGVSRGYLADALLSGPIQKKPSTEDGDEHDYSLLASGVSLAPNFELTAFDRFLMRQIANQSMFPSGNNAQGAGSLESQVLAQFHKMGFPNTQIETTYLRNGIDNHISELNGKWRRQGKEAMPSFEYRDRFNAAQHLALWTGANRKDKPHLIPDHKRTVQYHFAKLLRTEIPVKELVHSAGGYFSPNLIVDTMILDLCAQPTMQEDLKEAMIGALESGKAKSRNFQAIHDLKQKFTEGKLLAPIHRTIAPATIREIDREVARMWLSELERAQVQPQSDNPVRLFQTFETPWTQAVAKQFVLSGYGGVNNFMTDDVSIPGQLGCKCGDLGAFATRMMFGFSGDGYDIVDLEDQLIEMTKTIKQGM